MHKCDVPKNSPRVKILIFKLLEYIITLKKLKVFAEQNAPVRSLCAFDPNFHAEFENLILF